MNTPSPSQLRDKRSSCASGCAKSVAKLLSLRELRELRVSSQLAHACVGARARTHGQFKKSRNSRNSRNHAHLHAFLAQPLAQLAQPDISMTIEKKARGLMPETARLVDELRQQFGAELIDQAIAEGQRLRREYRARIERNGQAEADAWLDRQKTPGGCFCASERGYSVGAMPRGAR